MRCCGMPMDTKTIMSIWSFKRKRYLDGSLNKHKDVYVHMVECKLGDKTVGKRMVPQ